MNESSDCLKPRGESIWCLFLLPFLVPMPRTVPGTQWDSGGVC